MTVDSTRNEEIAIGVKIFDRTDRLEALLTSVPADIFSTVYIADDGPTRGKEERRERLYSQEYPFDLEILDLEYDSGVGYGRNQIVENFTENYLLVLDSDIQVPNNVDVLIELLQARSSLGGVSGCLAEPPENRIGMMAADFKERDKSLFLSPFFNEKNIKFVKDYPLVEFNLIPNVALFRRECLLDYSWDPNYELPFDHEDFYLGHWKRTHWSFAVCPQVFFPHYPGGDDEYLSRRWRDRNEAREYFLKKWGYDAFKVENYSWFKGGRPNSLLDRAKQVYFEHGALTLAKRSISFFDRISNKNAK